MEVDKTNELTISKHSSNIESIQIILLCIRKQNDHEVFHPRCSSPLLRCRPRSDSLRSCSLCNSQLWRTFPSLPHRLNHPFFLLHPPLCPCSSVTSTPPSTSPTLLRSPPPLTTTQVPCIQSAAADAGCTGSDYACRCTNSDAIQSGAQNCVISACGIPTALEVQASASAVCSCVATAVPT